MTPLMQTPPPEEAACAFTEHDFDHVAGILHGEAGIVLDRGKTQLVYARLSRRVRALGLGSFEAYCRHVASAAGARERRGMVEALTTNVTRFFRERHHFDHLASAVLPTLVDAARKGQRIRLWSAGCASGEEPYSMALTLLTALPDAAAFDVRVLATDIDTESLRQAAAGRYCEAAMDRVAPDLRERWFVPESAAGWWRAGDALRALVTFRQANLVGAWPMRGPFQVIFCRNTVIYFDADTCLDVWGKMHTRLAPGGYLYIGHSERMPLDAALLRPAGPSTFRRQG